MRRLCLAAFAGIVICAWCVGARADDKTYRKPRYEDNRLDWCPVSGGLIHPEYCGKPVADEFCKRRRFHGARDFRAENGLRHTVMFNGETCSNPKHGSCVGFDFIVCADAIPPNAVFAPPTLTTRRGKTRLDWCREFGTNCGQPAADAFCKAHAFARSVYFRQDPGVRPTLTIGTKAVCDAPRCASFNIITCTN